ncbi:unnamed protein product [Effrenium voratum]|nr:unnamed protein product [Effrenium voratum]
MPWALRNVADGDTPLVPVCHVSDFQESSALRRVSSRHQTAFLSTEVYPGLYSRSAHLREFLDGSFPRHPLPTALSSEGWFEWAKSNPLMVLGLVTPVFSIAAAALTGAAGLLAAGAASEPAEEVAEADDGEGMFGDFDFGDWGGDDDDE